MFMRAFQKQWWRGGWYPTSHQRKDKGEKLERTTALNPILLREKVRISY